MKGAKLNVFFMILRYFTQELLPKYFQKDIYYFRSPFSLWWGPSRRSLFWTFFTCQGPLNHHAKFRPPPSPPYTLLREFPKSWQILSSKSFFFSAKYGTYPYQLCYFLVMGFKMSKKWTSALALFLCFKTPKTAITCTVQCFPHLQY